MNDKLKQRLAGAAVLLLGVFAVVSLLPTPEQARHPDDTELVTIALHDVVSAPQLPPSSTAVPSTLVAAPTPAADGAAVTAGVDQDGDDIDAGSSSGDDDAAELPAQENRKPVRLALEPALKPESGVAASVAAAKPEPAAQPEPAAPRSAPVAVAEPQPNPAEAKPAVTSPTRAKPPAAQDKPQLPRATASAAQGWYVQVGGFADLDNARKVQTTLKAAGQPNLLAPIESAKGTIYRVRGGPYASEAAAQQALAKLKALGYPGSRIVAP